MNNHRCESWFRLLNYREKRAVAPSAELFRKDQLLNDGREARTRDIRSSVQCCFTSSETIRTVGVWGAQDVHRCYSRSSWTLDVLCIDSAQGLVNDMRESSVWYKENGLYGLVCLLFSVVVVVFFLSIFLSFLFFFSFFLPSLRYVQGDVPFVHKSFVTCSWRSCVGLHTCA